MIKTSIVDQANKDDDDDDDDDYGDEDDSEETALESYETPLDKEECDIDEYHIFKTVLEGKCGPMYFI